MTKTLKIITIAFVTAWFLFILSAFAFHLSKANTHFIYMLYNLWQLMQLQYREAQFIGTGLAVSSLFIIVFYKHTIKPYEITIKTLFVLLDVTIIIVALNQNINEYAGKNIISVTYGAYIGLTAFFIGETGVKIIKVLYESLKNGNKTELKPFENTLKESLNGNEKYIKTGLIETARIIKMRRTGNLKGIEIDKNFLKTCQKFNIKLENVIIERFKNYYND